MKEPDYSVLRRLTEHELELFWLLLGGERVNAIAKRKSRHPSSLYLCKKRLFRKLGIKDIPELIQFAMNHNLDVGTRKSGV
jgi:DNA-binding NarL/FixJ family response regulator